MPKHRPIQPSPTATVHTQYAVEALDAAGRWSLWGTWDEKGRALNPSGSFRAAKSVQKDLDSFRGKGRTGWRGSRIVKILTVREQHRVTVDPGIAQPSNAGPHLAALRHV